MSTSKVLEDMGGAEAGALLKRLSVQELRLMLCYIHGWRPDVFEIALKEFGGVCGVQADDDNWCILPKEHDGSHDAGEFTWDAWEEEPEPGTQAYADKYASRTVQRELLGLPDPDQPQTIAAT